MASSLQQRATLQKADHYGTYASPKFARDRARRQTAVYEPIVPFVSRTDAGCSTNSTTTVTDSHCVAADSGRLVAGTNIPAGAVIQDVTPGVSFKISAAATGTTSGLSLTISAQPDGVVAGAAAMIIPDQVLGYRLWGRSSASNFFLVRSSDSGATFAGPGAPSTSPEFISAVAPLPNGRTLFATADSVSISTPSTLVKLYMNDQALGSTFTQVADLDVGGYVDNFSVDVHNAACMLLAVYGYKTDSSTDGTIRNARFLYRSTDGGFTWSKVLDIGGFNNQHVHTPYVAPDNSCWLTTGDGDGNGTNADAMLDANRRAVWSSPSGAAGTWTPHILFDPDDGVTRLQAVGLAYFTTPDGITWLYLGEDSTVRGRIYRCLPSNPEATVEIVYDPAAGQSPTAAAQVSTWSAPFYALGVDAVYNVLWTFQRSELATSRGRWMASGDGLNFVTMAESGITGDGPGLIFDKNSTDTFNVDLNAANGGTLAQVDVVIERIGSIPITTGF